MFLSKAIFSSKTFNLKVTFNIQLVYASACVCVCVEQTLTQAHVQHVNIHLMLLCSKCGVYDTRDTF